MLKRLGKYLNKLGKLTIYHSFVLSNFNFCPLVPEICRGQVYGPLKERRKRKIIRNGAKTISLPNFVWET